MTSTSQVASRVDTPDDKSAGPGPRRRGPALVALAAGIVAVLCAVALPLLPVSVSTPVVEWPLEPGVPEPTALQLVTQRPLSLDVRFDCAAARAAGATPDGVVVATVPGGAPGTDGLGLSALARGDRLSVTTRGVPLYDGPLPPGPCGVEILGDLQGVRLLVDGRPVATAPGESLPDVDALTSSLRASPGAPRPDLSVRLVVDDQASSSPTAVKTAVTVLLVLAVVAVVVALAVGDRAARGASAGRRRWWWWSRWARRPRLRAVDFVVPAVMLVWLFLAPMTDDDGYYSAMAANVPANGYVANYYQLYNQSFTPFTWIYYVLSWWQSVAGFSPVVLRLPALVLGFATWALARGFVGRWSAHSGVTSRWADVGGRAALAICFLAWWLPYDMGVRPEAVVAASAVGSMYCLAVAVERSRRSLAAVGVGLAAFGVTAAPTGFVALAPLLAGAPGVWRMLRAEAFRGRAAVALIPIIAPGALVGALAFADGALRDFTRAQQIFLGMQEAETWYTEIVRWSYLLADGAMGNFAKRAPVLLGVFAVVVFLVLVATARRGPWAMPPRLALAGWTTLAGFALLWLTPSKWTHHFGTLAGVGGVLLAMVVMATPAAARRADDEGRSPGPAAVGGGLVLAVLAALAGHGPNGWPYAWLLGVPDADEPPQVSVFRLDQPVWYLLAVAAVAWAVVLLARRRRTEWARVAGFVAVPVVGCLFLLVSTTYLVGGFAMAAVNTSSTWSPWADAVRDPLARGCDAASELEALDPGSAAPLPAVLPPPLPPTPSFVRNGWFPASPPPAGLDRRVDVWGSFGAPAVGATGAEAATGEFVTPWYPVPPGEAGAEVATAVSGHVGEGNALRVEYARATPTGSPQPLGERELGLGEDGAAVDSTSWRSIELRGADGPPAGATLLRLVAVDSSTAPGGWIAFATPSVQRWQALQTFFPAGEPVAVGWEFAFLFPCQRKPVQANGINEPAPYALAWGNRPLSGLDDGIFQSGRGGHFAQSLRDGPTTQLSVRLRDAPDVDSAQLYSFRTALPEGGYRLLPERAVEPGYAPPPNTTFSVPVDDPLRPDS